MENLIYWNGVAIGYENGGRNIWFPSAPKDAIQFYHSNNHTA